MTQLHWIQTGILTTLLAISSLLCIAPISQGAESVNGKSVDTETVDSINDQEYYELFKLFADTVDQIERNYVKPVDRRELIEAAIRGLTTELDPYSNYIPPSDIEHFRSSIDSEFGGIGIQVTTEHGQLTVISPLVGTPAYKGGLLAGDVITTIEDESTEGITLDEAVRRMKGKIGTEVTLTVRHSDGEEETVTLKRELIRIETVLGDIRDEHDEWLYLLDEEERLGYVRLSAFSRHTARELRQALEKLQSLDCQGLVIDLRFNPGGLLSAAVEVSDMFVSSGIIVSTEGRNTPKRVWKAHQAGTYDGLPMAVLVNGYSASASEILAACLQDHGRAVVVGERTWGKGSVQNVVELEEGKSALKLTTASYQRPSGKNIHRFYGANSDDEWGVHPDEGFLVDWDGKQTRKYLEYRRNRDILIAQTHTDSTESVDEKDAASDAEPSEEVTSESESDTPSQSTDNPANKTDDDRSKQEEAQDAEPPSDGQNQVDNNDEAAPANDADSVNDGSDPGTTSPPVPSQTTQPNTNEATTAEANDSQDFSDTQLELALQHLRKQLAEIDRN